MDPDTADLSSTPNKLLRSKSRVLTEAWGTEDVLYTYQLQRERENSPLPTAEKWTTLKLPYQVPSCPPLPSYEQICTASEKQSLRARNGLHDICRMGNTVIKYSANPTIADEAETLLFLAEKRPQLNIPTVLAVWTVLADNSTPVYCLMMNFIDGILLESDRLAEFPVETQDRIFAKVSAQIQYLRSLPSEGYYGRVHRLGWLDPPPGLRTDTGLVRNVVGPYNTYEEYTSAIHSAFELKMAMGGGPHKKEWWPSYTVNSVELLSIFPGWLPHEPKFTWPDPKLTNIIVRPIKDQSGNEDWEVFLIDWEGAGWHPAWMQALQFQKRCGAMIRDRSQPPSASGHHPLLPYRSGEILVQMLKGFDPNPDWERLGKIRKHDWWFY